VSFGSDSNTDFILFNPNPDLEKVRSGISFVINNVYSIERIPKVPVAPCALEVSHLTALATQTWFSPTNRWQSKDRRPFEEKSVLRLMRQKGAIGLPSCVSQECLFPAARKESQERHFSGPIRPRTTTCVEAPSQGSLLAATILWLPEASQQL
jgi:hypothetical protein